MRICAVFYRITMWKEQWIGSLVTQTSWTHPWRQRLGETLSPTQHTGTGRAVSILPGRARNVTQGRALNVTQGKVNKCYTDRASKYLAREANKCYTGKSHKCHTD